MKSLALATAALMMLALPAFAEGRGADGEGGDRSPNGNNSINGSFREAREAINVYRKDPTNENKYRAYDYIGGISETTAQLSSEGRPVQGNGASRRQGEMFDQVLSIERRSEQ